MFDEMLILNDKFIVDWTRKAGCTTITKMVFGAMGILQEALDYDIWVHKYRTDKFHEKFGRVTEDMLSSDKFVKMKFVRNPYTRAVSSYLSAHRSVEVHDYMIDGELIDVSFYRFLELYKQKKLVNSHWTPQYSEDYESKFEFDEIIKIENLSEEVKRLNKKYNLKFHIDPYSRHHHEYDEDIDKFVGKTKYSNATNSEHVPTYEHFYDDEIKMIIQELYKKDFEKYGYELEILP